MSAEDQTLTRLQSTVLEALEEVENALKAYAEEQSRRTALAKAGDAARLDPIQALQYE